MCVCHYVEVGGGGRIVQLLVGGWLTSTVVQGSQGGGQGHHRVRVKTTFRMVFKLSGGFPKSVSGVNLITSVLFKVNSVSGVNNVWPMLDREAYG